MRLNEGSRLDTWFLSLLTDYRWPGSTNQVEQKLNCILLFQSNFESLWNSPDSKAYDAYLKELVSQAVGANPNISEELLASNLGLDKDEVHKTLESLK